MKYLLFLCILVMGGYTHMYKESACYSPIKNLNRSAHASLGNAQQGQAFIIRSSTPGTEKTFKTDVTEIEIVEEEEYSESSNSFTVILCALIFGYLLRCIKISLPFYKHIFYISSNRWHLIIQVFRV